MRQVTIRCDEARAAVACDLQQPARQDRDELEGLESPSFESQKTYLDIARRDDMFGLLPWSFDDIAAH